MSVNKSRTALVLVEADLRHSCLDKSSDKDLNNLQEKKVLSVEESQKACTLIKAKVPLYRVQHFLECQFESNIHIHDYGSSHIDASGKKINLNFNYLSDIEKIMAEYPNADVEFIKFDMNPHAVYFQSSAMRNQIDNVKRNLQIVLIHLESNKMSAFIIFDVQSDNKMVLLAICFLMIDVDTGFQYFIETFVKNNPEFCDTIDGIVVDVNKKNVDFIEMLIPQASLAWSRTYIIEQFTEEVKTYGNDFGQQLHLRENIMKSKTEEEYDAMLKELVRFSSMSGFKEFLRTWDSYKNLWVQFEINSFSSGLWHQQLMLEEKFIDLVREDIKTAVSFSELLKVFLQHDSFQNQFHLIHLNPVFELYHDCLDSKVSNIVCYQLAIALSSSYDLKKESDFIFVRRRDNNSEFSVNSTHMSCTCSLYIETNLPCQHIFAALKYLGKPLFNKDLIPEKYKINSTISLTFNPLSFSTYSDLQSLTESYELKRKLCNLTNEINDICSRHSNQQQVKDINLLGQVLEFLKKDTNEILKFTQKSALSSDQVSRKRGRPSKKETTKGKLQPEYSEIYKDTEPRHNLRTNLKHKFIKREIKDSSYSPPKDYTEMYLKSDNMKSLKKDEDQSNIGQVSSVLHDSTEIFQLNVGLSEDQENASSTVMNSNSSIREVETPEQCKDLNTDIYRNTNPPKTSESEENGMASDEDFDEEKDSDDSDDESDFDTGATKKKMENFLCETSKYVINEVIQYVSKPEQTFIQKEASYSSRSEPATKFLIDSCNDPEVIFLYMFSV